MAEDALDFITRSGFTRCALQRRASAWARAYGSASAPSPPTPLTIRLLGAAVPTNDVTALRNRCETMPSRACSSFESDRPQITRHTDVVDGLASSRDDIDSISEWYRTPRILEEPDCCEYMLPRDFMSMRTGSIAHSRTSSMGVDDGGDRDVGDIPDGYLPMGPPHLSSSASVCSGTPSTDLKDPTIARTPPTHSDIPKSKPVDEYVYMSPRNAGYVEMKPGEMFTPIPSINPISSPMNSLTPPDGYMEMSYRSRTRPIAITNRPSYSSPDSEKALHGSQTIFTFCPDSPPEIEHALSTVREISEEGRDGREGRVEVSSSPQYVTLARPDCLNNNKTARIDENRDVTALRNRCETMPSRACSSFESDRPQITRHTDVVDGLASSRDDIDSISEWYRTPRILEEPDCCEYILPRDFMSMRTGSIAHSRTSSMGVDDGGDRDVGDIPDGYLPMGPPHLSSSASVCSGTPSTDLKDPTIARTPPTHSDIPKSKPVDEYVYMSPRNAGYVEMKPGEMFTPIPSINPISSPMNSLTPPDGYMEMSYRSRTRPIAITNRPSYSSPDSEKALHGSQTIFTFCPDSPPEIEHALSTVREISEEGRDGREGRVEVSSSPQYVTLARPDCLNNNKTARIDENRDVTALRNRCETMPSRACSSFESDRPQITRHTDVVDGLASSRDDIDSISEWYRTPRILEEPDCCEYMLPRDFMSMRTGSIAHSRTSSMGVDDGGDRDVGDIPDGYLPMGPPHLSSSASVCSGTPSTDLKDPTIARTPPTHSDIPKSKPVDEYVYMSPRNAGYVEMKPGEMFTPIPSINPISSPMNSLTPPDGYMEMSYRSRTRPIAITNRPSYSSPDSEKALHGSQTIFTFCPDSPPEIEHALSTVREISEEGRDGREGRVEVSSSPQYVTLARPDCLNNNKTARIDENRDVTALRNRCETMPSRACSSFESDRPQITRHTDVVDGLASSRDDIDSISEWYRTPRILEEPDCCEYMLPRDFMSMRTGSIAHSRTSSMGVDDGGDRDVGDIPDGYLPMGPPHLSSSASVCSGTPSTDLKDPTIARTPPTHSDIPKSKPVDEYVYMSPRNAGYVEMKPGEMFTPIPSINPISSPMNSLTPPDGYMEMSYRSRTRPIAITNRPSYSSPDSEKALHGSQTIFTFCPDSPPEIEHALSTVREISEEGRDGREGRVEVSSSPQYVTLARPDCLNNNKTARIDENRDVTALRNRCETMPSRACSSFESDRPQITRHTDVVDGLASSRDDIDSISEWYRTPRILEEPDCCEYMLPRDFMSMRTGSIAHSRTSSMGVDDGGDRDVGDIPDGYLPMGPPHLSSSASVCSGTPSTDLKDPTIARTPPTHSDIPKSKPVDEYVYMSPRNAGYVEMKPGEMFTPIPSINPISSPMNSLTPPDGYMEMSYRSRTRPIAITNRPSYSSPDSEKALHGSQTIFTFCPDSPPEIEHALSTVREISEEGRDGREGRVEVSSSPQYVTLARPDCLNNNKTARIDENRDVTALRNRCETMPSRACSSFESDRPQITRHTDVVDGLASSRDDIDSISEWYRTPRILEEPDCCEYILPRDFMSMRTGSIAHSRTSSMGVDDGGDRDVGDIPDGYLPMGPPHLSSSASVCSGTPSTDLKDPTIARTPPTHSDIPKSKPVDEYVYMSPRNAGYVEMKPGEMFTPIPSINPISSPMNSLTPPDGYMEMSYRSRTRPIAITNRPSYSSPDSEKALHGSQTIFTFCPDSPPEIEHALSTVREISEEGRDGREGRVEVSSSPQYVTLARPDCLNNNKTARIDENRDVCTLKSAISPPDASAREHVHACRVRTYTQQTGLSNFVRKFKNHVDVAKVCVLQFYTTCYSKS
ncbi:uncharacterized protein LOC125058673 isoform X2 [Pieris napi]|uniref:uncharacterized protein LOC125058673 isoform X2 n=1 Tax=Pieris napi TaxID=78633 RepID=UPI001FB95098|nr:uncharacterized protein LOC125058673 isoform X2 [Pieris napi]